MEFFVGRSGNVSQRQGVRIKTGQDVQQPANEVQLQSRALPLMEMCQESGRMRGSVGSCPHHGSWPVSLPSGCVWPL